MTNMFPISDIIILTYNNINVTKRCIESLLKSTSLPIRLIIIDNASSDETPDYLASLKSTDQYTVEVIINKDNKGFVGGMNQGMELAVSPYVCLANNDLIFTKGWLEEIITVFKNNETVGVLNPNSNNLGLHPYEGVLSDDFVNNLRSQYKNVFVEMPFCIGFCMVMRRELIKKVGGFSQEFEHFFFEDTDFSMKAVKAGYLIGMAKASYVWHSEHTSIKLLKDKETIFRKNRETFFNKWGRILRIAWVLNDYNEVLSNLNLAIKLARQGNYIWVFVKNLTKGEELIFEENNMLAHSGIKFIPFSNIFNIVWKIGKKKKKYDLLISKDKCIRWIFENLGYKAMDDFNEDIEKDIYNLKRKLN